MYSSRNRNLGLLATLGIVVAVLTGCSLLQSANDSAALHPYGPFPLGVPVQQGRYQVKLETVSVNGTKTIALSQRVSSDPMAVPDTATAATLVPSEAKTFLVSAGGAGRPTARVGYRFLDAVISLRAPSATGTVDLQRGVITTATVLAGGKVYPLGDRSAGLAKSSSTVYETLEFELPMTADSAVLRLGLKDTEESLGFRLW
jgi:hypothetical protein